MRKAQTTERFENTEKAFKSNERDFKKLFKNFEKVLTNENECDIIIHALLREVR